MSRSYKKVPGLSDGEGRSRKEFFLRLMNRRIRSMDLASEDGWLPEGNRYRRFVCRWDYRDYNWRVFGSPERQPPWIAERFYRWVRK